MKNTLMMRVVKLGGSLLDWPPFAAQLLRWIGMQTSALNVLVVGGGGFAEEVRRLDEVHGLTPRDAHWLAAETMQVTAKFVTLQLSNSIGIKRFDELIEGKIETPNVTIFDAWQFLCEVEPNLPGERLPESWDTTSDSIAARLAIATNAPELVLLKSALPRRAPRPTIIELADEGYVDAALPRVGVTLKGLRCVNLRDAAFAECDISLKEA
jgi:5-(aminomethyl)-3-furanmethanol phosphate kinase